MNAVTGTETGRIALQYDALDRLAAQLGALAAEIGQRDAMFDAIGDLEVRRAFDRAEGNWNAERRKVREFLAGAQHSVQQALQTYRANEAAVARSASGPRG